MDKGVPCIVCHTLVYDNYCPKCEPIGGKKMDKIKRHKEICDRVHDIYKKKNEAYGDSFSKTFNEFGLISAVVRIYDKVNRIIALTKGAKNDIIDESLKDSLLDLSGYSILTIMELEKTEEEKNEG